MLVDLFFGLMLYFSTTPLAFDLVSYLSAQACKVCSAGGQTLFGSTNLCFVLLSCEEPCCPACLHPLCIVGSLGSEFI